MTLKETYAERLKTLRITCEMSQNELAEKLNTSQANITRSENGKVFPSVEMMVAIADLFGMPLDYFFGRGGSFPKRDTKLKGQIRETLHEELQPGQDLYELIRKATEDIMKNK